MLPLEDPDASLLQVNRMLDRLSPPFRIEREILGHKVKVPFFFHRLQTWQEHGHKEWMMRWKKMEDALAQFPSAIRIHAGSLLRRCDSRFRLATHTYDKEIKEYNRVLKRERKRLKSLEEETLFPLPVTLAAGCRDIHEKLTDAQRIVDEAEQLLSPAKEYFLNQRSTSRPATKKELNALLLSALQSVPNAAGGHSQKVKLKQKQKQAAADLTSELLCLADPKRPATEKSIRQLNYPRKSPPRAPQN